MSSPRHLAITDYQQGELYLISKSIDTLRGLRIPAYIKNLDISNNRIAGFDGIDSFYNVEKLIMDGNPLLSFYDFPESCSISDFSAIGTPLSRLPIFKDLCVYAIGLQLRNVNGEPVDSSKIKKMAQEKPEYYSSVCSLVRKGWIGDVIPKGKDEIEKISANLFSEPVSVRITRLMKFIKHEKGEDALILEQIFDPKSPTTYKRPIKEDPRVKRQQALISYLETQLEEVSKPEQTKSSPVKLPERIPVASKESHLLYEELLRRSAESLLENANIVSQSSHTSEDEAVNFEELRESVCHILNVDVTTPVHDLIRLLRQKL